MSNEIKRAETSKISHHLNDCRLKLRRGNIHACLRSFKSALEKTLTTQMLPSDEKEIMEDVNSFQAELSRSKIFKDIFGPVSFHAKDLNSSLDFIKQLIRVEEEEILDKIPICQKDDASVQDTATDIEKQGVMIMELIDQGEYVKARELIADNDILITFIVQSYNRAGISFRKEGNYDSAIAEYEKALIILPDDEGLYYNIARTYAEKKDWERAGDSIREALKIDPHFKEGIDLLKYVKLQCIEQT